MFGFARPNPFKDVQGEICQSLETFLVCTKNPGIQAGVVQVRLKLATRSGRLSPCWLVRSWLSTFSPCCQLRVSHLLDTSQCMHTRCGVY